MVVQSGLQSDIRMNLLQLSQDLFEGSIVVPYVDRLKDGKSAFRFAVKSYIGGLGDSDVNAVIPSESCYLLTHKFHGGVESEGKDRNGKGNESG